jgi:hypothetical protein
VAVATVFVVLVLVAFGLLHHVAGGELEYIAMDPAPNIKKNEHKPNSQDRYSQIPSCFASAHQHPYALTKETKQLSLTSTLFHREINPPSHPPKSCKNGKKKEPNFSKTKLASNNYDLIITSCRSHSLLHFLFPDHIHLQSRQVGSTLIFTYPTPPLSSNKKTKPNAVKK